VKAAFLTGIREIEIRDIPEPDGPGAADVLLKVDTVGVCGSDMHYYRTGRIGDQVVEFPWLIGHECAASVVEVGSDVEDLKAGDRVAVDPLIWCNQCDQCRRGRVHTCRDQRFLGCPGQVAGCMTELLVMPAQSCFKVPDGMNMVQAALVEPFAIGVYARRLAGDVAGRKIAILGSGPIGLCVLRAIRVAGEATVYMTDIRDYRAEHARKSGADWVGNPDTEDVVATILQREPVGLDLVFECAGEQDTVDQGLELLVPGGMLLVAGIPEVDRISFLMDRLRRKEITVQPVRRQNHCEQPAIDLVAGGKVELESMVTHHFPLEEAGHAYDIVADYEDGAVKVMVHVS
jgi:L-iditol 2-dehydrogenase